MNKVNVKKLTQNFSLFKPFDMNTNFPLKNNIYDMNTKYLI